MLFNRQNFMGSAPLFNISTLIDYELNISLVGSIFKALLSVLKTCMLRGGSDFDAVYYIVFNSTITQFGGKCISLRV